MITNVEKKMMCERVITNLETQRYESYLNVIANTNVESQEKLVAEAQKRISNIDIQIAAVTEELNSLSE